MNDSESFFARENKAGPVDDEDGTETDLPRMAKDATFRFECGPDAPCFNKCCRDLEMPLTPRDVLGLRRALGESGKTILQTFAAARRIPETGFPLPYLRMIPGPENECPFLSPAGCSVYDERPGACRAYPLGRGASVGRDGVNERVFLVAGSACLGFGSGPEYTSDSWFAAQDMRSRNYFNDRFMRLMSLIAAGDAPLDSRLASLALLCLYQPEDFRRLIKKMKIFERVNLDEGKKELILGDSLAADEACLDFAFDWLELSIFGVAENLSQL